MKSRPILLLAGIVAAWISSAAERTLLFSDDFDSPKGFADSCGAHTRHAYKLKR